MRFDVDANSICGDLSTIAAQRRMTPSSIYFIVFSVRHTITLRLSCQVHQQTTKRMHSAWYIYDVIHLIFVHLDSGDLARLARCSTVFHDHAIDALWETVDSFGEWPAVCLLTLTAAPSDSKTLDVWSSAPPGSVTFEWQAYWIWNPSACRRDSECGKIQEVVGNALERSG